MGVPKVVINDNMQFVGMQPAQAFLRRVLKDSQRPQSRQAHHGAQPKVRWRQP